MDRFLKTSGAEISYQRVGNGPAVLLIQGAGAIEEGWRPQIEALRNDYTLYAFDNRGIGKSVNKKGALTRWRTTRSRSWMRRRSSPSTSSDIRWEASFAQARR